MAMAYEGLTGISEVTPPLMPRMARTPESVYKKSWLPPFIKGGWGGFRVAP